MAASPMTLDEAAGFLVGPEALVGFFPNQGAEWPGQKPLLSLGSAPTFAKLAGGAPRCPIAGGGGPSRQGEAEMTENVDTPAQQVYAGGRPSGPPLIAIAGREGAH